MTLSVMPLHPGDEQTVPAEGPSHGQADPGPPVRRWGPMVLAFMPGLWLFPRSLGPVLASARLRHALTAHGLSMVFGLGLIVWAVEYPWLNPVASSADLAAANHAPVSMTWWEIARGSPAALVTAGYERMGAGGGVRLVGLGVGLEAALLLVAVAVIPFGRTRGSPWALYGRSLRLTYWSTTLILPVGLAFLFEPQLRQVFGVTRQWWPIYTVGLAGCGLWWLWVLLRLGRDCGPLSQDQLEGPHLPRCERCGYVLAYLQVSSNCPECGQPVRDSLPESRNEPAVARAEGFWSRWTGHFSTLRAALTDRKFFRTLAVYRRPERARSFVIAVCGIDALLMLPGIPGAYSAVAGSTVESELWAAAFAIAIVAFCGQVLLAGLLASMVSAIGRRPLLPTSVAMFYGLSSLLPITAIILIGTVTYLVWDLIANLGSGRALLPGVSILAAIALGMGLWVGSRAVRCLGRAIKDTRYANA